jgi:hypothetical protein
LTGRKEEPFGVRLWLFAYPLGAKGEGQVFEVLIWEVKVIKSTVVGWERLVQYIQERGARLYI